jgi:hypothetical protein
VPSNESADLTIFYEFLSKPLVVIHPPDVVFSSLERLQHLRRVLFIEVFDFVQVALVCSKHKINFKISLGVATYSLRSFISNLESI